MSGAIIMGESSLYTFQEFMMVILGGSLALSGVWVIIKKPAYSNSKKSQKSKTKKDQINKSANSAVSQHGRNSSNPYDTSSLIQSSRSSTLSRLGESNTCSCEKVNIDIEK